MLNLIMDCHDRPEDTMVNTRVDSAVHVSYIMEGPHTGTTDGSTFLYFPLCLNKNFHEDSLDESPFELYEPLTSDTVEQILDSYFVQNNSSFAIMELFDNA